MLRGIKISPNWNEDLFGSYDQMGRVIMESDENMINLIELHTDNSKLMEILIHELDFCRWQTNTATTDIVYYSPLVVWKMMYVHIPNTEENLENLIGSILHPEHLTTRGVVIFLKFDGNTNELMDAQKEDLIFLLERRKHHQGLCIQQETKKVLKTLEVDNLWNSSQSGSLRSFPKQIKQMCNYTLLMVRENDDIIYVFNMLDMNARVIIDFTEQEWALLTENENIFPQSYDDQKYFCPYDCLVKLSHQTNTIQ